MRTFDDLKRDAEQHGGLAMVSTSNLCEMEGNERATRASMGRASGALAQIGLGHLPAALSDGDAAVVVYVRGTPAGKLIDAVVKMTEGRDLRGAMEDVRAAVATPQNDALEIVAKIRALVRDPAPTEGDETA